MKRISLYVAVCLLAFGGVFTSCDNEETLSDVQEVAEDVTSSEENEDGMFTVSFVNPDGTPYVPEGETKVDWKGTSTKYPYRTTVDAQWSDFKKDDGDMVKFSGGDANTKELTSGSYRIANNIDKDYTVSVAKYHKVKISAGTGGTVSPSGEEWRLDGSTVTVTATPNSGYEFSKFVTSTGWEQTANPKQFSVSSCFTVTAYFKAVETQTYTITVKTKSTGIEEGKKATVSLSVSGHNSMSPNSSQIVASSTSVKTWTITANKGATVTMSVSCDNYDCDFDMAGSKTKTFSNLSSNQSATIYINY